MKKKVWVNKAQKFPLQFLAKNRTFYLVTSKISISLKQPCAYSKFSITHPDGGNMATDYLKTSSVLLRACCMRKAADFKNRAQQHKLLWSDA